MGATMIIGSRHFGRWAALRNELTAFSSAADGYIREHGAIDSEQKARLFRTLNRKSFSFGADEPSVDLVYLWWLSTPQVGIQWGTGGTAAFNLTTMICVYSD
jgi:hypothetical protein